MASTGSDDRVALESFDGSEPGAYRKWKRRAQLTRSAVPNTVPKEKLGPRLMQVIKGEAEQLCERIPVEDLCSEGGDLKVFKLLDEKYGPQPVDLLHTALKTFFYELMIKPSETYQQLLARFATAVRLLEEQEVKLPEVVLGYMLLKKLRLYAQSEAMLLTATKGELKLGQIVDAVKAVCPEGPGNIQAKNKKAFLTQAKVEEHEETDDELQEVMEAITDDWQQREDASDEDILEAFETYAEVRRKWQNAVRHVGRRRPIGTCSMEAHGSVNGRIELLKARTRCHLCKRPGHS